MIHGDEQVSWSIRICISNARVYGGFVLDGCVVREPHQTRECSPSYTDEQFIKDTLDGIVSKCNRMEYCGTDLGEGKVQTIAICET